MSKRPSLQNVLEVLRRHVQRATAGTGLAPSALLVELRFGLRADEHGAIESVLQTLDSEPSASPHTLKLSIAPSVPATSWGGAAVPAPETVPAPAADWVEQKTRNRFASDDTDQYDEESFIETAIARVPPERGESSS